MNSHLYDLSLRVLVYKEDGQFVAHALEADILGYGDTEDQAAKELENLLEVHMIFSTSKGRPEMVLHRAPQEFFDRWEEAHEAQLMGKVAPEKTWRLKGKALVFAFGKSASREKVKFSRMEDLVLA